MADNHVEELVASLVEAFRKCGIALSLTEADYQALLYCICPDLFQDISQEDFAKVYKQLRACNERLEQECANQVDAAGPSSTQPAPVQQDVADASEERISDVSEDFLDLDLNKSPKEKELVHNMAAPEEPVEENTLALEKSMKRNKAVLEGTVEHKAALEELVEQKTAAPEETVKNTTTSEETWSATRLHRRRQRIRTIRLHRKSQ